MDDFFLQKVSIHSATLASILHRLTSSVSDVDGLLFGHVAEIKTEALADDSNEPALDSAAPRLVAVVTSFQCPSTPLSFYDALGRVDNLCLNRFLSVSRDLHGNHLLGWFSARRRTPVRPSMREFSVMRSLSADSKLAFPVQNSENLLDIPPCVFILFTTASSLEDQLIHTHEYRGYQFCSLTELFEPKSVDIVNVGQCFRGHYGSFCQASPFPLLRCEARNMPGRSEDGNKESLSEMKQATKDQVKLDAFSEGFSLANLNHLVGSDAFRYTATLEGLYEGMLVKLEWLVPQVEKINAEVLELENCNRMLRHKASKSALE